MNKTSFKKRIFPRIQSEKNLPEKRKALRKVVALRRLAKAFSRFVLKTPFLTELKSFPTNRKKYLAECANRA